MSDTFLWSFGFRGRGLPPALERAFLSVLSDPSATPDRLDAALFPDLPIQTILRDAAFACLRAETAHFTPEQSAAGFFWRASLALHDDLALQAEEFFFAWLCQYAAQDRFFGMVMNDVGASPRLLFAIDQAAAWVSFEKGLYGAPGGALSPEALRRAIAAGPTGPLETAELEHVAGSVSLRRWRDMAALFDAL